MDSLIFEHPLNEKCRNYLRFEALFTQINHSRCLNELWHHQPLFNVLFDLVEISDRADIKPVLVKDLERQKKQLEYWSRLPGVDQSRVSILHNEVITLLKELNKLGKVGMTIKEDKFLASIRQRFILPGGTCCFDLPNLHWWLHQPKENLLEDINRWLLDWDIVARALTLLLGLMRERGDFSAFTANGAFFQGVAENAEMLRIRLSPEAYHYPTISGHKHRYAIRFMQNKTGNEQQDINFELACCAL